MATSNPYSTARTGSFASAIRTECAAGCAIALLGLPDDTGVAMNNGRVGAREGPRAFRQALCRYGGTHWIGRAETEHIDLTTVGVFDAGDVQPHDTLDATHDAVSDRINDLLDRNLLPVCIGGGHDLTWPAVRAVANRFPGIKGVYFDAHLDVREERGSGMPFRKILTETTCEELTVVGLDGFANRREHFEWFTAHGGRTADFVSSAAHEHSPESDYFVSFDLDVINVSHAPGVSAINPVGVRADFADAWACWAGNLQTTQYFDIMELNPTYDIDGRTARLAARLFLSFVAGYARRIRRSSATA